MAKPEYFIITMNYEIMDTVNGMYRVPKQDREQYSRHFGLKAFVNIASLRDAGGDGDVFLPIFCLCRDKHMGEIFTFAHVPLGTRYWVCLACC